MVSRRRHMNVEWLVNWWQVIDANNNNHNNEALLEKPKKYFERWVFFFCVFAKHHFSLSLYNKSFLAHNASAYLLHKSQLPHLCVVPFYYIYIWFSSSLWLCVKHLTGVVRARVRQSRRKNAPHKKTHIIASHIAIWHRHSRWNPLTFHFTSIYCTYV